MLKISGLLVFLITLAQIGNVYKLTPFNPDKALNDTIFFEVKKRFVDAENLGKKGYVKIAIQELRDTDRIGYMNFQLYLRKNNTWICTQKEKLEVRSAASVDPQFIDFNNDGCKDLIVRSGEAARGANEIKTLYIFDRAKNKLVRILNSDHYPNLRYNSELNCIDAWLVYGGSSTVFLKLEADTLREFAAIHLIDLERKVELIDRSGKTKVISKDKIKVDDMYTTYSNYNPLKLYKEPDF